jgi:metal-sulfur cluster biosynthetic enzyme
MVKISKKIIEKKLAEVMDPELNISILDLGLIYDIKLDRKSKTKIIMTLTTIGCPLISLIEQEIKNKLKEIGINEKNVAVELTFDPPWTMEKMSARAKAMLGI